jgi:hypothetical protein
MCNNVSSDNGLDGHRLVENNLANIAHILRYHGILLLFYEMQLLLGMPLKRYIKQVLSRPGSTHRYNKHIVNKTIQGIEQCILRFTPYLKRLRKPSPSRSPYRSCFLIHSLGGITHRPEPTPFFSKYLTATAGGGNRGGNGRETLGAAGFVDGMVTRLEELEAETLLSLCEQV